MNAQWGFWGLIAWMVIAGSVAKESAGQTPVPPPEAVKAAGTAPSVKPPETPPWPKFEDVTKDMESQKGLFILWQYPESAKDKDQQKLLCQIPAGFLGQKFMLSSSFSGGGFMTGFPIDEHVVKWELLDRQLVLIQPETRMVIDDKGTISDVVRRTYPDRIRAAVPIVTKSPSGDPVIDLGALLKTDFAGVASMSNFFFMRGGGGGVNPSLSKWLKPKAFELNVEIGVELAVGRGYPPGSFDKKLVHYSLWKLPQTDYQPRIADDRVGYFLTANQDWSKPTEARDIYNRYIDRWNLVKRDPSLAKCEPKEPITFYIEKTVPVKFRKAVRDGIMEWNKAFEKCGFVDAVQVRQQTDDNEWKDLDPEDMRYSFFRWIVTGGGFAMGPHRSNPFTGQIYDADIVFDDSMVRFYEREAKEMLPSSMIAMKARDPAVRRFLAFNPQWMRSERKWESFVLLEPDDDSRAQEAMAEAARNRGVHGCDYADGMMHQLAVARAVLGDQPPEVVDRLLYDAVKEVVTHEVGHTLGLRHNFKASTIYSLDEIKKRRKTDEATCGSVMDYNPILFFTDNAIDGRFITPTIGPWDYWVIEYGYRPADGTYKPAGGKKDGAKAETGDESPTTRPAKTLVDGNGEGGAIVKGPKKGSAIPSDVMKQLPPDVRKQVEAAMKEAGPAEAEAGKPAVKGAKPPLSPEQEMLRSIAARSAEPELAYATDEDTTLASPDPRSNRFDMGDDPIAWSKERIKLVDKRMADVLNWAIKDGESWYFVRNTFMHMMMEKAFVLDYVGRYIGGQYTNRSHRGDPDGKPPFELVDPTMQRRALAFIEETLYTDRFVEVSPEVLNHLTSPRWYHDGAYVNFTVDFPLHEMISMMQWWNLFDRLMPNTLRRIQDAEWKTTAKDKFTVAEYISRLQSACWADSVNLQRRDEGPWSDGSPYVSDVRRSLQREYLNLMEPMVRMPPGMILLPDLHAMMQQSLRKLSGQIAAVMEKPGPDLDFASQAHLTACRSRIDRMLAPRLEEYNPRQTMFMMMGESAGRPQGASHQPDGMNGDQP